MTFNGVSQYGQGAVREVCSVRDAEIEEREGPMLDAIVGSSIAQYTRFGYRAYQVLVLEHDSTKTSENKKRQKTE